MTTGMPMKADTVLMGSVMSEGGSWVARSQSSMMPPPHTIEAGMRMRWSASRKAIRTMWGTARPRKLMGPQ